MASKKKVVRYGLMDRAGAWAFAPKFEALGPYAEGRVGFRVGTKWGFADATGKVVVEPAFDFAYNFAGGTASVEVDGQFLSIDRDGAPIDRWAADPSDGRISIATNARSSRDRHKPTPGSARYGYLDLDGNEVIAPSYVDAFSYTEGRALVRLGDGSYEGPQAGYRYQFIDHAGAVAVPEFRAWDARVFSGGLARYKTAEHRWRFIDLDGNLVVDTNALECGRLQEDRVSVCSDNEDPRLRAKLWGYLDRSGAVVVEPTYVGANDFRNGRALVRHYTGPSPTVGFIDLAGKLVIENQFRAGFDFAPGEGGTAPVSIIHPQYFSSSLWGLIGRDGEWVIEPEFVSIHPFIDGCAAFERTDGTRGLLSATGEVLADGYQDLIAAASGPLIAVNRGGKRKASGGTSGGKWGFVDRNGREVIPCTHHAVGTLFQHGYAALGDRVDATATG